MTRSIARAARGATGIVTTLPPLGVTTSVRWPRSTPRATMSAPVALDTRSPLRGEEKDQCMLGGRRHIEAGHLDQVSGCQPWGLSLYTLPYEETSLVARSGCR
jgi:hypothetical protein